MTTTINRRLARFVALPVLAAGILGGALGFAGAASATPTETIAPPHVTAAPAPEHHPHHGLPHLSQLQPDYRR
ncbi:hypothetical protein [Mycolicibacterium sp. XJ1904]